MLNHLKSEANIAYTENGAVTNASTMSDCLDLFAVIGALRAADDQEIIRRFVRAYAEDADIAMKILFFGRDVRGGLGERRVFRVIIHWLAENRAESLRKNIELIPEFGRYDDLVSLIGTACEKDALRTICKQLEADLASDAEVSLLAKWLPSVNASSAETVRKAKRIARYLCTFNEVADTNVEAVFDLILDAAVRNNVPQEELPETLYLISDMEFNACVRNASVSNFASAKRRFAEHGYRLPQIVFWNVASRNSNQPVTKNEQGVALVSGCTPRLFSMVASGDLSPYSVMMDIIESERYAKISA